MSTWITIRSFIAFYFVVFGITYLAGVPDMRALWGSFFVAIEITFFWRLWVAMRKGLWRLTGTIGNQIRAGGDIVISPCRCQRV